MIKKQSIYEQWTIPNSITMIRILGTVCLLAAEPLSAAFYVIYTVCGISDVLDGFIARTTKKATEFGAKLDSAADLFFYAVMVLKLRSFLWKQLPKKIWLFVGVVLLLRVCSYTLAAWKYHRFSSQHTYLNKLTGAAMFVLPYVIAGAFAVTCSFVICGIAMAAALEELCIHISSKEYRPKRKSLWKLR